MAFSFALLVHMGICLAAAVSLNFLLHPGHYLYEGSSYDWAAAEFIAPAYSSEGFEVPIAYLNCKDCIFHFGILAPVPDMG